MRPLVLAVVALLAAPALAQPAGWTARPQGNLPASVEIFETGPPGLRAWLVRADLTDPDLVFDPQLRVAGRTVPQYAADQPGTLVAVNGGYFQTGQSFSLVVRDGTTLASNIAQITRDGLPFFPTRSALGRLTTGALDVAWIYNVGGVQTAYPTPSPNAPGAPQPRPTATFPAGGAPWPITDGIGGGPVLVQDGRVRMTWTEEVFFGGSGVDTTAARARTVAGYDASGTLLLLVARENPGLTLRQAGDVMVAFGAREAVNLDGGGSSALWADGETLLSTGRAVASAVLLRARTGTDALVLDTDGPAYRETGTWFESANAPHYGPSRSRLSQVGDGSSEAVYTLPSDLGGAFQCGLLDVWWVPAPNRATNARFRYRPAGGGEILLPPVNQSDPAAAGRWNFVALLGGLDLFGGEIVLTNDATGTATPAFVNIDAIRIQPQVCPSTEAGPLGALDATLAPNPAAARATLTFGLPEAAEARMVLVDALGRTLRDERRALAAGPQAWPVDVRGLAPGVYAVRVEAAGRGAVRRLTVAR